MIGRYFRPLTRTGSGALELRDDAAVFSVPPGRQIVATADALVAGVHFRSDDPPDRIARKLLRVNLSDLAAMGAAPLGYLLAASWPRDITEDWIAGFAEGLAADQAIHGVALLGGDTTRTPGPMTLSLTALGTVAPGGVLRRGTARPGNLVFVSGTIGDASLGLEVLQGGLTGLSDGDRDFLAERYHLPRPRLTLGQALAADGLATAALDVSDGLVADLTHIAEECSVAAVLVADRVPLSSAARAVLAADRKRLEQLLTGGDDYELLFTVAPARRDAVLALAARLDLAVTEIGRIEAGEGARVEDGRGAEIPLTRTGWRHF